MQRALLTEWAVAQGTKLRRHCRKRRLSVKWLRLKRLPLKRMSLIEWAVVQGTKLRRHCRKKRLSLKRMSVKRLADSQPDWSFWPQEGPKQP